MHDRFRLPSGRKPLAASSPMIRRGKDGREYRWDEGIYKGGGWYSVEPSLWPADDREAKKVDIFEKIDAKETLA